MSTSSFSQRDRWATERMDAPDCDPIMLNRTYAQFRFINTVVAGWQETYRRHLCPVLHRDRATTVLDIGSGGGDMPRALIRWAARDGYQLHVTAIDPDPRAHFWATGQPPVPGLIFEQAFSNDLLAQGRTFDVVTSNHLLHHLDDGQFQELLVDSQQLARAKAVHSDISRSRWAYLLFSTATWPFFRRSFIREDGLTSIRRSYTGGELQHILPPGWRVEPQRPWRNLVIYDRARAGTP